MPFRLAYFAPNTIVGFRGSNARPSCDIGHEGLAMCDCCSLAPLPREFGTLGPRNWGNELSGRINGRILARRWKSRIQTHRKGRILSRRGIFRNDFNPRSSSIGFSGNAPGGFLGTSKNHGARRIRSNSIDISGNLGDNNPEKYESLDDEFVDRRSSSKDGLNPTAGSGDEQESSSIGSSVPSSFEFLELKRELDKEETEGGMEDSKEDDAIRSERPGGDTLNPEEVEGLVGQMGVKNGRQLMRRSNLLAKQVISIQSARSLGFVSQLWVDTRSWVVVLVEVRPNLLAGEIEKFFLEDISQIGDVVLVQDESVMENKLKMIGLDTLVGYNIVTSGRRNVGKVRGYTFNINSGAVESLEFDSFGFSIIPSSLVSTYSLFVEDVLEVVSDTVVVHEYATSRIQKLTKGIWDTPSVDRSRNEMGEYSDFGRRAWSVQSRSSRKKFASQKFPWKMRDVEDDWDLPMDY